METYAVSITDEAARMLRRLRKKYGAATYDTLRDLILDLKTDPDKKGEPLRDKLAGLWSLHYSRFRIIYRIIDGRAEVIVVAAGFHESASRDDIYEVVERMIVSGRVPGAEGKT